MPDRRRTAAGLGLLAAVVFGVAGCASASPPAPGGSASAAPPSASTGVADPAAAQALADAAAKLSTTSEKITMTMGSTLNVTSELDPPNGNGTATVKLT